MRKPGRLRGWLVGLGLGVALGATPGWAADVEEALAAGAAAAEQEEGLRETVEAQASLIQELRDELQEMGEQQAQGEDRLRALEDQRTAAVASAAPTGDLADWVDARIEDFDTAPEGQIFLSGYGSATWRDAQDDPSTFLVQFNPIFHYTLGEKLHFNAELEIGLGSAGGETETEIELEYATIDYFATDWLTVSAGKFLLPFNIFGPRLHPQWINKMASSPPIYGGHGGGGFIPVLSDVGVMLSGGHELWSDESKVNYAIYAVNGLRLEMEEELEEGGHGHDEEFDFTPEDELLAFEFENVPDDNDNKSIGGRIGFVPIPSLEIGASYMTGRTRGSGGRFNLIGADASYWWRGLDLRAEYARISRNTSGADPEGWGYWVQAAYRLKHALAGKDAPFGPLSKLEPVIRYGEIKDLGRRNRAQLAIGLNYWLYESVPIKFTYEVNSGAIHDNRLFLQLSYGF